LRGNLWAFGRQDGLPDVTRASINTLGAGPAPFGAAVARQTFRYHSQRLSTASADP